MQERRLEDIRSGNEANGHVLTLDGTLTPGWGPPSGAALPTADPHSAGKLWVDTAAGFVVKVSQG